MSTYVYAYLEEYKDGSWKSFNLVRPTGRFATILEGKHNVFNLVRENGRSISKQEFESINSKYKLFNTDNVDFIKNIDYQMKTIEIIDTPQLVEMIRKSKLDFDSHGYIEKTLIEQYKNGCFEFFDPPCEDFEDKGIDERYAYFQWVDPDGELIVLKQLASNINYVVQQIDHFSSIDEHQLRLVVNYS